MAWPRTSIITCTHDMAATLKSAVASALAQTSRDFEYLILDDGSTDGTRAFLETLSAHPHVRLFRHDTRRGLAASRNALLDAARGEYVGILDADDRIAPRKVEHHARLLDRHPEAGMVWGRALLVTEDSKEIRKWPAPGFRMGWDLATPYRVAHSASTWRRAALLRAGGYDPRWERLEAPDMFLKVGDFSKQLFTPETAALVRLRSRRMLRAGLVENAVSLSRKLRAETIYRRYGKLT